MSLSLWTVLLELRRQSRVTSSLVFVLINGLVDLFNFFCSSTGTTSLVGLTSTSGAVNMPLACQEDIFVISTLKDTNAVIDIMMLVSDPDDNIDVTSLKLISGPLFGSALLNWTSQQASITYIPPQGFQGTDLLVYSICDLGFPTSCCSSSVAIYVLDPPKTSSTATGKGEHLHWCTTISELCMHTFQAKKLPLLLVPHLGLPLVET